MPKSKKATVVDRANALAGDLADKIGPHVESARDKAAPVISDVRSKTGPMIADARDKAAPVLGDAKDRFNSDVLPLIAAAAAAASEATEEAREETRKRGKATVAALRGDVEPPKKKHRLRKLLILAGLGGIAAFVAKKLSDREATTAWESSYTPSSTQPADGAGAHRAETDEGDDQGGSSPDVAAADAAAEPHRATTPDAPAETVEVNKAD
jgi:F0F1-type ATP synthase membrane subunit b/b'